MKLFRKIKNKIIIEKDEGMIEEDLAIISSAVAMVIQPKTKEITVRAPQRTPYSHWKLMGIKDQMVYGKQRKGVRVD